MRFALLACLAGCTLYWDPSPPPPICNEGDVRPSEQLRDPDTGSCTSFDGGNGCSPYAQSGVLIPDWAPCAGPCEGLGEAQCLATTKCHATYLQPAPNDASNTTTTPPYWGCWEVEPSGPTASICEGLDAFSCTSNDYCIGIYLTSTATVPDSIHFDRCAPEKGGLCATTTDCAYGETCDTSTCHMAPCPDCQSCGACAPTCYGVCTDVPPPACSTLDEAACKLRSDCDPIYNGQNCTCDPNGCTCQIETFAYCEAR